MELLQDGKQWMECHQKNYAFINTLKSTDYFVISRCTLTLGTVDTLGSLLQYPGRHEIYAKLHDHYGRVVWQNDQLPDCLTCLL